MKPIQQTCGTTALDMQAHRGSLLTRAANVARFLRGSGAALVVASLATGPAQAGGTGTFPHLYDVGTAGDFYPASDVAVYADGDVARFVFVADRGAAYRILRYDFAGQSNVLSASVALTPFGKYSPIGLAVNDVRGSMGFGDVYACQYWNNIDGLLSVMNTALGVVNGHVLKGVKVPNDVAVDAEGNVYVSDGASKSVYMYAAAAVQVPWAPLMPVRVFKNLTVPTCVSVDHNNRVHTTAGNSYRVFNTDTTTRSLATLPFSMDVCALNPCADGWVARLRSGVYDFVRYDWNWCDATGAEAQTAGLGWLARPEGMEYQKYTYGVYTGQIAPYWQQQKCDERMFVATMTGAQLGYIRVFGQSTLSVPVPNGRRAWWRFEQTQDSVTPLATNCLDALGTQDAVPVGVPRTVEGMVRLALDTKDGTTYATAADDPILDFGTGSLSIEGWLRSEQTTGVATLLDKRVGTGAGYSVYLYNGYLGFQTNVGGGVYQNYSASVAGCGTKAAVGAWKHFAIVLDRTNTNTVAMYLDGALLGAPVPALAATIDNSSPLYFGRTNYGGTPFKGALDEITLYDQPLTAGQVLGIFQAGSAGKHVFISSLTGS